MEPMQQTAMLLEKPLIFTPVWPFVFAILAAGIFGYLALRFGQSIPLWASTAGISTLVVGACAAGLFHSVAVPYSPSRLGSLQATAMLLTFLLMAGSAALVFFLEQNRQRPGAAPQKKPAEPLNPSNPPGKRPL